MFEPLLELFLLVALHQLMKKLFLTLGQRRLTHHALEKFSNYIKTDFCRFYQFR